MRITLSLGLVALLSTGCYTVLRHPQLEEGETRSVGRSDRCISCHSDGEMQAMEYGLHPGWYPDPWWGTYYGRPWWWDDP